MKVFITGGTTGIGLELAKIYLTQGNQVAVTGRNLDKYENAKLDLPAVFRSQFLFYQVDVANRDGMVKALHDFAPDGPQLVIANAGISMSDKKAVPNFDRAHQVINTNVLGVLNTLEGCLGKMLSKKSGHVVLISSIAGMSGLPGSAAYSASKGAVTLLGESFAIDLKKHGIHFTTICPGFIDTPLTQKNPHPMPFIMSAEKAAAKIKKAIDKKREFYSFPFIMALLMRILYLLPRNFYLKLMRALNFDFSKK